MPKSEPASSVGTISLKEDESQWVSFPVNKALTHTWNSSIIGAGRFPDRRLQSEDWATVEIMSNWRLKWDG